MVWSIQVVSHQIITINYMLFQIENFRLLVDSTSRMSVVLQRVEGLTGRENDVLTVRVGELESCARLLVYFGGDVQAARVNVLF